MLGGIALAWTVAFGLELADTRTPAGADGMDGETIGVVQQKWSEELPQDTLHFIEIIFTDGDGKEQIAVTRLTSAGRTWVDVGDGIVIHYDVQDPSRVALGGMPRQGLRRQWVSLPLTGALAVLCWVVWIRGLGKGKGS